MDAEARLSGSYPDATTEQMHVISHRFFNLSVPRFPIMDRSVTMVTNFLTVLLKSEN